MWALSSANAVLVGWRSEEHTSELQSLRHLVCRLLLEKKNKPAACSLTAAAPALRALPTLPGAVRTPVAECARCQLDRAAAGCARFAVFFFFLKRAPPPNPPPFPPPPPLRP